MTKLQQDAENMEEIMCRTADRCDIWQDRYIYWIAVAIWHIIQRLNRLERRGKDRGMNREICGECKYHTYEEIDRGYVCTNADSPYCTDWTDYTDTCDCFEQRGVE